MEFMEIVGFDHSIICIDELQKAKKGCRRTHTV